MDALSVLIGAPASLISEDDEIILRPVLSEDISESASVTSHAVEDGSDITDHVQPSPSKLSLSLVITRDMSILNMLVGSDKSPEEKIRTLELWRETGELLTYSGPVFKGVGIFKQGIDIDMKNIVITGMAFKRDSSTGGGFLVTLSFDQIKIAYAKTVSIALPKAAQSPRNQGQCETGNTASKKNKQSKQISSILYDGTYGRS